jgi:hypothetical protein
MVTSFLQLRWKGGSRLTRSQPADLLFDPAVDSCFSRVCVRSSKRSDEHYEEAPIIELLQRSYRDHRFRFPLPFHHYDGRLILHHLVENRTIDELGIVKNNYYILISNCPSFFCSSSRVKKTRPNRSSPVVSQLKEGKRR